MNAHPGATTNGAARNLEDQLRAVIMDELAQRDLLQSDALAAQLDVLPLAAAELLRSSHWSIGTALWVVERLELPVRVSVTYPPN